MEPGNAALDIVLLRTFLEVVDAGGFALAGERLALTPSAVSGHIRRLEQAAGTGLLLRTTRSFRLTPAGELLYVYARNIVSLDQEVRARLRNAPAEEHLRIGASEDFAGAWLPDVLQAFRRRNPGASVQLRVGVTADLVGELERGNLDLVFGKQCGRVPAGGRLMWEEELVWAFDADGALDPAADVLLAVFPEPCVYREAAIAALSRAGKSWRLVFESSSMAGCLAAARAGFAVTPVARSQLRSGLRVLGAQDGLPELPDAQFYVFTATSSRVAGELASAVDASGKSSRFRSSPRW